MTVINTNVGALMARTYASKSAQKQKHPWNAFIRLCALTAAADDAAGMAVANKMQSQLKGIKMAIRNSQDGISLVQTAESGMGRDLNMILRMRELAVQMENGIYTAKTVTMRSLEVNALLRKLTRSRTTPDLTASKFLDGSYDQSIRAGNTNAETIRVSVDGLTTATLPK